MEARVASAKAACAWEGWLVRGETDMGDMVRLLGADMLRVAGPSCTPDDDRCGTVCAMPGFRVQSVWLSLQPLGRRVGREGVSASLSNLARGKSGAQEGADLVALVEGAWQVVCWRVPLVGLQQKALHILKLLGYACCQANGCACASRQQGLKEQCVMSLGHSCCAQKATEHARAAASHPQQSCVSASCFLYPLLRGRYRLELGRACTGCSLI